jgi:hypothetical protein
MWRVEWFNPSGYQLVSTMCRTLILGWAHEQFRAEARIREKYGMNSSGLASSAIYTRLPRTYLEFLSGPPSLPCPHRGPSESEPDDSRNR